MASQLVPISRKELEDGDIVLFKGSNAIGLSTVERALRDFHEVSISSAGNARSTDHPKVDGTSITLCGDTSLGDSYLKRCGAKGSVYGRLCESPLSFFEQVAPLIADSHSLIVNLETCLLTGETSSSEGKKRYVRWDDPDRAIDVLKSIGVDAVNLANNHTTDFGSERLLETIAKLLEAGIAVFGAGKDQRAASKPLKRFVRVAGRKKNFFVVGAFAFRSHDYYATVTTPGVQPALQAEAYPPDRAAKGEESRCADRRMSALEAALCVGERQRDGDLRGASCRRSRYGYWPWPAHAWTMPLVGGGHRSLDPIGNFVLNSPGRYARYAAPPFGFVTRLDIHPRNNGWASDLKLYPIVTDNRRTDYQARPVDRAMLTSIFSLLKKHAPDLSAFHEHFEKAEDERGFHLRLLRPISPRFA